MFNVSLGEQSLVLKSSVYLKRRDGQFGKVVAFPFEFKSAVVNAITLLKSTHVRLIAN